MKSSRDATLLPNTRNAARYFVEVPQVAWVALVFTLLCGVYACFKIPKASDPVVELRVAVASCNWPGTSAEKLELLVTRKLEQKISENQRVEKIESTSRTGSTFVYVTLRDDVPDRAKEWDDIQARLDSIRDLPEGAGPIRFQKDYSDTAAMLLTVASPPSSDVELELRAASIVGAIERVRGQSSSGERATLVVNFSASVEGALVRRTAETAALHFAAYPGISDVRRVTGPDYFGIDVATSLSDTTLREELWARIEQLLHLSEIAPEVWRPLVVRDLGTTGAQLRAVAGPRYTYRELDVFSDTLQRHLRSVPSVSKVTRTGVLPEQIHVDYSQTRFAAMAQPGGGLTLTRLAALLAARNTPGSGGLFETKTRNLAIQATGEFANEAEIGALLLTTSTDGSPIYLRDVVDVTRGYQSPPTFLHYLVTQGRDGKLERQPAITLSVNMRAGGQIEDFGKEVDAKLELVRRLLPRDLFIERTTEQPREVRERLQLFGVSLAEAVLLVVLVTLLGFKNLRAALIVALSIPLTLAMTVGLMTLVGVDLQQISIAALIISLGLLVDDPVVALDAIDQSVALGWKARIAAWLGPTKLAAAILFATVTNILAYLPLLTVTGDTGRFIRSLPIVVSLSLVASRIVSMTFVPFLASLFFGSARPARKAARSSSARWYRSGIAWAIDHKLATLACAALLLGAGGQYSKRIKVAFFPQDLSYLAYVNVWLPEDASFAATRAAAARATEIIAQVAKEQSASKSGESGLLESVSEFIGGGGPRFWFSVAPEQKQLNYAQLLLRFKDKRDTARVLPLLQQRLSRTLAGARIDVRALETGKPVGVPIAFRVSGDDVAVLREYGERLKQILRDTPGAERVRDDWGADTLSVHFDVEHDRATLAGVSNTDVARSATAAMSGLLVGRLREEDRQIDIVARLVPDERAEVNDLEALYVSSQQSGQMVPLGQVSRVSYAMRAERIQRLNQFRTLTVSCFPAQGLLSSEVVKRAKAKIGVFEATLAPGYTLELGGEQEHRQKSFTNLARVVVLLVLALYLCLLLQFKSAFKPLLVLAAIPFGVLGALASLALMNVPFGFMAFVGVISLMGVIVSHVIILFVALEDARERGVPMRQALEDAGALRVRPVLVTVGATILGLIPLALHGGPLWEPLCVVQIGGLLCATIVTLVIVPVLYACAAALGWIPWTASQTPEQPVRIAG
ncbi:MAG: efflux RND transporter permease subunit [Pseudomonadota bacterium]